MKQQIVDEALGNIRDRKNQAELNAKNALVAALKNPEFANAYTSFTNAKIEKAKAQAFGEKVGNEFEKSLEKLKKVMEKHKIHGITPIYHCTKCNDTGFIDGQYCECLKSEISKILLKKSGFGTLEEFKNQKFDLFSNPDNAKKIYAFMQEWCNSDSKKKNILICGNTGTGKTHLTKCMAHELVSHGCTTQMITAFALNQKFLAIHLAKEEEKEILTRELFDQETLIIDDLGTEPMLNNVTREYLYLLLNERQNRALRTVITTNLFPNAIMDRYGERILSRLMNKENSIVIEMSGNDLRVKKNNKA